MEEKDLLARQRRRHQNFKKPIVAPIIIDNKRIDFSSLTDLEKIKLLLIEIDNRFEAGEYVDLVYRAVKNKSHMYIYLFDVDLLVTIIKTNNLNDDNCVLTDEQRKTVVRVQRISSYGNFLTMNIYDCEEIQNFCKKLVLKFVDFHYKDISEIDKIIDANTIVNVRNGHDIIDALMGEAVYSGGIYTTNMKNCIERFDSVSRKDIVKKNLGRNPVFY